MAHKVRIFSFEHPFTENYEYDVLFLLANSGLQVEPLNPRQKICSLYFANIKYKNALNKCKTI